MREGKTIFGTRTEGASKTSWSDRELLGWSTPFQPPSSNSRLRKISAHVANQSSFLPLLQIGGREERAHHLPAEIGRTLLTKVG